MGAAMTTGPETETAIFECREFRENAFRSMEVQICGETKTVQFCAEDHGGDHPTAPSVAIDWRDAIDLANWIISHTSGHAQCSQDRNETLRGLAAFFSESVHHVWDKDEIADCLTNMISADSSTDGK